MLVIREATLPPANNIYANNNNNILKNVPKIIQEKPRNIVNVPFSGIRAQVVEIPESLDSFKSLQVSLFALFYWCWNDSPKHHTNSHSCNDTLAAGQVSQESVRLDDKILPSEMVEQSIQIYEPPRDHDSEEEKEPANVTSSIPKTDYK